MQTATTTPGGAYPPPSTHDDAERGHPAWKVVVEADSGLQLLIRVLERFAIAALHPSRVKTTDRDGTLRIELDLQAAEPLKVATIAARIGAIRFVNSVDVRSFGPM